jgi:hypothetical protein
MRKLILTTAILLTGLAAGYARGMHSTGTGALMAPANPTVPPSLTLTLASPAARRFHRIISQRGSTWFAPGALTHSRSGRRAGRPNDQ